MVRTVGEVLALEADAAAAWEGCAARTWQPVAPVVGVHLHAWLGGIDFHRSSADGIAEACCEGELHLLLLVQHEAVVVAGPVPDLFVVGVDVLSYRLRCAEVEGCPGHLQDLARRDARLVDRDEEVGINLAYLVGNLRCGISDALEREESVVRQVDDGLLVRRGHVADGKLVVVGEGIDDGHLHLAREAFFEVGRHIVEHQCVLAHLHGVPHARVPSFHTAVERVGAVVDGQLVFLAVERKLSLGDAVAVASDERREVCLAAVDGLMDVGIALDDVGTVAVFVGHHDGQDSSAIVGHCHFVALIVAKDVEVCILTVDSGLKILSFQTTEILCF